MAASKWSSTNRAKLMGFENVEKLAAYLDAGPAKDACQWLHEHSGDEIVEEYREMLHSSTSR
jgi:hypothetical protein